MEIQQMEFEAERMSDEADSQTLARAIGAVDPDAKVEVNVDNKTIKIYSWLLAEEFLIAFEDAGYRVKISKG